MAAGALLALAAAGSALAAPLPAPTLTFTADGQDYDVPILLVADGRYALGPFAVTEPGYAMALGGSADADPEINFVIGVVDNGDPTSFHFTITLPMGPPVSGSNLVSSSLTGTLTDATGDGASLTPTIPDEDGDLLDEIAIGEVNDGVTDVNMGVDLGVLLSIPALQVPGSFPYGPFVEALQPGPGPGPWQTLRVELGFTLSGNDDELSLSGVFSIVEAAVIPEPATLSLLGVGLLAATRRRRRT